MRQRSMAEWLDVLAALLFWLLAASAAAGLDQDAGADREVPPPPDALALEVKVRARLSESLEMIQSPECEFVHKWGSSATIEARVARDGEKVYQASLQRDADGAPVVAAEVAWDGKTGYTRSLVMLVTRPAAASSAPHGAVVDASRASQRIRCEPAATCHILAHRRE